MGGWRNWIAFGLAGVVLAPALVLADAVQYTYVQTGPEGAATTAMVQQHSVFIEMFRFKSSAQEVFDVTPYAAIVGLIKECQIDNRVFDTAVLWFNDQFLFGSKANTNASIYNAYPVLGQNRGGSSAGRFHQEDDDGFGEDGPAGDEDGWRYTEEDCGDEGDTNGVRYGHFIPDVFIVAEAGGGGGYQGSYYVTDPNGHAWIVDKFNRKFVTHTQVDPSDRMGFRDEAPWAWGNGDVRPGAPRYDAGDNGTYADTDSSVMSGSAGGSCPAYNGDARCSIEYDFLIVVDFTSTGGRCKEHGVGGNQERDSALRGNSHGASPEDHGEAGLSGPGYPNGPGNSTYGGHADPTHEHPCQTVTIRVPDGAERELPEDPVGTDLDQTLPDAGAGNSFSQVNYVWDVNYRAPPPLNTTCEMDLVGDPSWAYFPGGPGTTDDVYQYTLGAVVYEWHGDLPTYVANRTFLVCDVVDDAARFHQHDGTQTTFPS